MPGHELDDGKLYAQSGEVSRASHPGSVPSNLSLPFQWLRCYGDAQCTIALDDSGLRAMTAMGIREECSIRGNPCSSQ